MRASYLEFFFNFLWDIAYYETFLSPVFIASLAVTPRFAKKLEIILNFFFRNSIYNSDG